MNISWAYLIIFSALYLVFAAYRLRSAVLFLLVFLPFLALSPLEISIQGTPMAVATLLEVAIYLLALVYLVRLIYKKEKFSWLPIYWLFILLILAGLFATAISPDKFSALGLLKAYFFDPMLLAVLAANLFNFKQIKKIVAALALSAVLVVLIGIFRPLSADGRLMSIFPHPNYLAMYLFPIFLMIVQALAMVRKRYRLLGIIAITIIAIGLILTESRSAMLGVGAGLLSSGLIYFWARPIKKFYKALTAVAAIIALALALFLPYALNLVSPERLAASETIRIQVWQKSLEIGAKNPVAGVGLGNFQNHFTNYTKNEINFPEYISPHTLTPHNIFLNYWLQVGLLGLIIFIALLFYYFRLEKDNLKKNKITFMPVMIGSLFAGLFDTPFWKNELAILFWLIIALAIIGGRHENRD